MLCSLPTLLWYHYPALVLSREIRNSCTDKFCFSHLACYLACQSCPLSCLCVLACSFSFGLFWRCALPVEFRWGSIVGWARQFTFAAPFAPPLNILHPSLGKHLLGVSGFFPGTPAFALLLHATSPTPSCAPEPSSLRSQPLAGSLSLCYITICPPLAFSTLGIAIHNGRNMGMHQIGQAEYQHLAFSTSLVAIVAGCVLCGACSGILMPRAKDLSSF